MSILDTIIDGLAKIISDLTGKPVEECRTAAAWIIYSAIIIALLIFAYKIYSFAKGKQWLGKK